MATYTVEVGKSQPATKSTPSAGPIYRSIYAKDGLIGPPEEMDSPWDLFSLSAKRNPKNKMLGFREIIDGKAGSYLWQTYEEVYDKSIRIGSAVRKHGINQGETCGIYGFNCPEWIISMLGCCSQGISYVPLYDTLGSTAVEFIINHAELSLIFVHEKKLKSMIYCLPNCAGILKTIVSFGKITDSQKKKAEEFGVSCFSWEEFALQGERLCELPSKNKNDICTIMYTSGTTGDPKGVILSNRVLMAHVMSTDHLIRATHNEVTGEDTYFSLLPLAHIFDQIFELFCIYKGTSIGYWQGDPLSLLEDVRSLKPTLFCGVPRVYERFYSGITGKIMSEGALKKILFQYAYQHKLKYLNDGFRQEEASPFFDKHIFNNIKLALGGEMKLIISGGAPLPRHIEEFFRVTSCCCVTQGYGLTESCGGCFSSITNVFSMMGTVGVPLMNIEARLESVPDMGYDALGPVPRGEICIRGKTLFSGYYKRQDLTDEVIIDGWFHTGDIGEWQADGTLKIIDRKKNIFKLSQGEYVAVENIECVYGQSSLISSIWVYGNSFESFLVAVVIPNPKALEDWASNNQETGDFESLCKNPKARKFFLEEMNTFARKHGLRGFEIIKAIHLEPKPFDIEQDLLTPTFKLKRPQLLKHYKNVVDSLYCEGKESQ